MRSVPLLCPYSSAGALTIRTVLPKEEQLLQGGSTPEYNTSEHSKSTCCSPTNHPDASSALPSLALYSKHSPSELSRLLVLLFHFPEEISKAMIEKQVADLLKVLQ